MLKYYSDLSSYKYYMLYEIPEIRNVGWLDRENEFATGTVEPDFIEKLKRLIFASDEGPCKILVNELRGSYACPICEKKDLELSNKNEKFILGSSEIWIPEYKAEGHYFATFGLIIHYIKDHGYKPPQEFIDSVLILDINLCFNGQAVRDKLVRKCAGKE
jgi:hypothetical protein